MVQQPLRTLTAHIKRVRFKPFTYFWSSFLLMVQVLGTMLGGRSICSSGILALAWLSPGCCSLLGSDQADERFSIYTLPTLSPSSAYRQVHHTLLIFTSNSTILSPGWRLILWICWACNLGMVTITWPLTGFELTTSKEDCISRFHCRALLSEA